MSYIRRYTTDPGNDVLLEIEHVAILDLEPPAAIIGVGTGVACLVGEFENGEFNKPTEISGSDELMSKYGLLGYTVDGIESEHPCARKRYADGAIAAEYWNGNGFVQLNGKRFKRLVLVRVDTSVGSVEFTRMPFLTGSTAFTYDLEPGQILAVKLSGGGAVNATFDAAAALVTGAGATYAFTGGETQVLGYDDAPNFTVTFLATDTTVAAACDRINLYAGFTFATVSGGQVRLTSRKRGSGAKVVVGAATGTALTKLGLTQATTNGTGDAANIDAVTFAEVKALVESDIAGTLVEQDQNGALRISALTGTSIEVATTTTADGLGFPEGAANDGTGTEGKIPAGTVVTNAGGSIKLVTMQDVTVTTDVASYSVKVRHATDDGTGLGSAASTMVKVANAIKIGSFKVTNAQVITAALTESQIDAAYETAINSTLDDASDAKEVNLIWSARQSGSIRSVLRQNALDASADGLAGRMAMVRPPLGTLKAVAKSGTTAPGVGAYRSQRVIYCYPGVNTTVPLIKKRGKTGGAGFTADGAVDIGADGFMASVLSQMNPEQNPGEMTDFMLAVNSVEKTLTDKGETLKLSDYIAFKKAGIAAPRMEGGKALFQSGVTSVDKTKNPGLVNINRRRMADYIQDTLAQVAAKFSKMIATVARRNALVGEIVAWLASLLSKNEPNRQRIAGYTVDQKTGNTPELLGAGLFKVIVKVKTLSTLDTIVIATTVGEQVEVEELLAA